jgi:hypothetical protein
MPCGKKLTPGMMMTICLSSVRVTLRRVFKLIARRLARSRYTQPPRISQHRDEDENHSRQTLP